MFARSESSKLGVDITLQRVDRQGPDGGSLHNHLAVFRYDGLFLDAAHAVPYDAHVEISHLLSGNTRGLDVPAEKLSALYIDYNALLLTIAGGLSPMQ